MVRRFSALIVALQAVLSLHGTAYGQDPGQEFSQLTGGKSIWVRADISHDWQRCIFDQLAADLKVRSGQISKEQYVAYIHQQQSEELPGEPLSSHTQQHVNESPANENWTGEPVIQAGANAMIGRPTIPAAVPQATQSLPTWFVEYDRNRDGQVGFHEWRLAGRPLSEFSRYDHNGDGFVTSSELRRISSTGVGKMGSSRD
jgi:hypothetical protein